VFTSFGTEGPTPA